MNNQDVKCSKSIKNRAQKSTFLEKRIEKNVACQKVDFIKWIFDKFSVGCGDHVLELCCGTGMQTLEILRRVGTDGRVVAVDISQKAIDSISSRITSEEAGRLTLVESDMDSLDDALRVSHLDQGRFDKIFCAYGLYYSKSAKSVLDAVKKKLNSLGSVIVVGPFGPNNRALFDLLEQADVNISDYVKYTSHDFMYETVVPWATENFTSVRIHTVVNEVRWPSLEDVVSYWSSSTFYSEARLPQVSELLRKHFLDHAEFVNEKWIMMLEMSNAR